MAGLSPDLSILSDGRKIIKINFGKKPKILILLNFTEVFMVQSTPDRSVLA